MDAHRWQRIREIFEAAVELPPRERDPYIKKVCEGDTALFEELMAMLEADGTGHRLLDQPVRETVDPFFQTDLTGRRFGRFRIIREIGSGGMGAVYLAERADGQYEQQVALKLIKPGLHSGDLVRRFEHERQILARLEHPNIARLLDGGISDEGTPYFVMEYVSGLPIDRYCNQNRLTIEERVRLFITVCQAVQFAHYNLVIHRDLKPGNIFITDDGTVKLLDFGIAKVFSEEQELPALTRTGNYALTPEFAAPEQIRNQHITTATDVYALGLILFELLCGQRPFEFDSTSLLEMERIIETTDPPRPSSMIKKRMAGKEKTLIGEAISASEQRQTSPERLFRKLRGDLDTICLMALNREPARRYGSAELFMQDLDRFLRGLPVRARRESLPYRLQKFARRHRWGVLTTAVVSLILIIKSLPSRVTTMSAGAMPPAISILSILSAVVSSSRIVS